MAVKVNQNQALDFPSRHPSASAGESALFSELGSFGGHCQEFTCDLCGDPTFSQQCRGVQAEDL